MQLYDSGVPCHRGMVHRCTVPATSNGWAVHDGPHRCSCGREWTNHKQLQPATTGGQP